MKILKNLGLFLLVLAVIGLIAMFFLPTEVKIERQITIKAGKEVIWSNLKFCANFPKWSPWHDKDPHMNVNYFGTDGAPGGGYEWSGNDDVKSGKSTILNIEEGKKVTMELRFGGFDAVSPTSYELKDNGDGSCTVTWSMSTPMGRPSNLFGPLMRGMIEKDFDKGLAKLRDLCEKEQSENSVSSKTQSYQVQETTWNKEYYLAFRKKVGADAMGAFFAEQFPKLYTSIGKNGGRPGIPCSLIYSWDEQTNTGDIAAAVPTDKALNVSGFQSVSLNGGKALVINFYGDYKNTGAAHMAMEQYLKDHQIEANYPCIEQYVTDPQKEPDTAKWLTKIVYFVK